MMGSPTIALAVYLTVLGAGMIDMVILMAAVVFAFGVGAWVAAYFYEEGMK